MISYSDYRLSRELKVSFCLFSTNRKIKTYVLGACFYGTDQVNLIDGGRRSIEQLKVGDRIWSMTDDTSRLVPDEVILIMHNGSNQTGLFEDFERKKKFLCFSSLLYIRNK
jgi:hypothetical protein